MNDNITNTDKFDRKRLLLAARYYQPSILPVMLVIFTISAIGCALMAFMEYSILLGIFGTMLMTIPSFIAYFAPMTLNVGHQPVMNSMLPTTSGEKLAVLAASYLIIIPLIVYLPSVLFSSVVANNIYDMVNLSRTVMDISPWYYIISIANTIAPCATCLYCVIRWPGNKARAILTPLAIVVTMFVAGSVIGIRFAYKTGFADGINGLPPKEIEAIAEGIVDEMIPVSCAISVCMAIYTVFIVWATYKALKSRQL